MKTCKVKGFFQDGPPCISCNPDTFECACAAYCAHKRYDGAIVEDHKTFCSSICPPGWIYTGFDGEFYCFQRGDYRTGFFEMCCLEEDLTAPNLRRMAELGVTRVTK